MNAFDPLAGLPDIHLPQNAVGWWPLAPGWWMVIIVVIATTIGVAIWRWRKHRSNRWRREALAVAHGLFEQYNSHHDIHRYATGITQLMKRIARTQLRARFNESLTGNEWIEFIRTHSKAKTFGTDMLEQLQHSLYAQVPTLDATTFHTQCLVWIEELP